MEKIVIKNWVTGAVLFEHECEGNSLCLVISQALKQNVSLAYADLSNAYLSNAYLSNADLSNAYLSNAYLRNANLRNADLSNADLRNADLRNANLSNADLSNADLRNADLRNAYLSNAYLSNAYLSNADLRNAYLSNADLSNANLSNANLSNANLSNANLSNANLSNVDLSNVDLSYIKRDLFALLVNAIKEVDNLKSVMSEGKIDGSTYEGQCACLCGTLEKTCDVDLRSRIIDLRDSSRAIEMFFTNIRPGHTPENHNVSKLVYGWIEEFQGLVKAV